jgi:hypothetical protein
MKQELVKDFSPMPGVDYIPKRDANLYKKGVE